MVLAAFGVLMLTVMSLFQHDVGGVWCADARCYVHRGGGSGRRGRRGEGGDLRSRGNEHVTITQGIFYSVGVIVCVEYYRENKSIKLPFLNLPKSIQTFVLYIY